MVIGSAFPLKGTNGGGSGGLGFGCELLEGNYSFVWVGQKPQKSRRTGGLCRASFTILFLFKIVLFTEIVRRKRPSSLLSPYGQGSVD